MADRVAMGGTGSGSWLSLPCPSAPSTPSSSLFPSSPQGIGGNRGWSPWLAWPTHAWWSWENSLASAGWWGGGRVDFWRLPLSSGFPALLFLAYQASISGDGPPRALPGKPLPSRAYV